MCVRGGKPLCTSVCAALPCDALPPSRSRPQASTSTSNPAHPPTHPHPPHQIASLVTELGQSQPCVRNIMTLKSCAPISGAEVRKEG